MSLDQDLESPIIVSCTDLLYRGLKGMERMKGLKMTCKLCDVQNVHVFQFASFWAMLCNNQVNPVLYTQMFESDWRCSIGKRRWWGYDLVVSSIHQH